MSGRGKEPAISVVIPSRNEAGSLSTCLDALEGQDFPRDRYELIVVDGHSTDGCDAAARARGVRLLSDHGDGPSAARNLGIRAARAPIVAFTDADCIPERDWLTRIAEVFAEDPLLDGVGGGLRVTRLSLLGRMEDSDAQAAYRGFITSNVAYRREVLLALGGFDEKLQCCEDYDLAWRAMDAGYRVLHDPRPLVVHNPPEIAGPIHAYLKKQWWYGRNDVPAHARAVLRGTRAGGARVGAAAALLDMGTSLRDAGLALALVGGALARSPLAMAAGAGGAALLAGKSVVRAGRATRTPLALSEAPARVAVGAAKTLARGFGTLAGLAELAKPERAALLRPGGGVVLGPEPAHPRAAAGPRAWA